MNRKKLKKILEDALSGKDVVSLFLNAGRPPYLIYWTLKAFLENPDLGLVRKVSGKFKVSPQYLFDRVSDSIERIDKFRETNPYAILNLTFHADAAEIQESWKQKLKEWHPDTHGGSDDFLVMTQKINDAYRMLRSPETRKDYDRKYAPFLVIVKDIEAHGRPSFLTKGHGSFLQWRYIVMVALLVAASLFVWERRHRPVYKTLAENGEILHLAPFHLKAEREKASSAPHVVLEVKSKKSANQESRHKNVAEAGLQKPKTGKGFDALALGAKAISRKEIEVAKVSTPPVKVKPQIKFPHHGEPFVLSAEGERTTGAHVHPPIVLENLDFSHFPPMSMSARKAGEPHKITEGHVYLHVPIRQASVPGHLSKHHPGDPKMVVEKYFECYRRGNYQALLSLFDVKAVENGVPVKTSMKSYRTFFRCLKVVKFDFEEKSSRKRGNKFFMDGKYIMEYKKISGKKKVRDAGRISFVVVKEGRGGNLWLIKDVEYHSE